jgi:leucyl aminopeptidase (aminopeptidase T)
MSRSSNVVRLLALSVVLPSVVLAGPPKGPDLTATAEKLVGDVLGAKEKEVVVIEAQPADQALVDELVAALGKRGASPMVRIGWPSMNKKWLQAVPEANDAAHASLEEKLIGVTDAIISIERNEDPGALDDVAPARIAAFQKALSGLAEKRMKKKIRSVTLGNGLAPGKANAKALGLTEAELSALFWAGVGTDYKALAARAEAVKAAVPAGKEITITTPAGTNLKLKLAAKPMSVSDGVISADEAKAGGPALLTWLPAGEVYGLVDAASAEGKIVVPRHMTGQGTDLNDLTLTIKAGKVTELTAKPSKAFDRFKQLYDAAPGGKELVSILDFGVNADVKAPKGKQLLSFVPAGAVTLMIGSDVWAGGTNAVTYGQSLFLPDATVTIDGKAVVEKGELKVSAK